MISFMVYCWDGWMGNLLQAGEGKLLLFQFLDDSEFGGVAAGNSLLEFV